MAMPVMRTAASRISTGEISVPSFEPIRHLVKHGYFQLWQMISRVEPLMNVIVTSKLKVTPAGLPLMAPSLKEAETPR